MSTVKVEVQLSSEELLKAVEQLNQPDLERFVSQILALQAQRKASSLTQTEAELLLKINQGIPSNTQKYYEYLAQLARLRGIPLIDLMKNLGIQTQMYV